MKIVGCDLHARQQTIAMVDTETGEFVERTLSHEGNALREFYAALEGPMVLGIEATGSMQWFLELLRELGIQCRVGHPAKIRAKETRKQKHDRRDARLILELLIEDRFPEIWMPSIEERDLRTLLRDLYSGVEARLEHRRATHPKKVFHLPRGPRFGLTSGRLTSRSSRGPIISGPIIIGTAGPGSVLRESAVTYFPDWLVK